MTSRVADEGASPGEAGEGEEGAEAEPAAAAPAAAPSPGEDSSDSDGETEPARSFHRKISTNKDIKCSVSPSDGLLRDFISCECQRVDIPL